MPVLPLLIFGTLFFYLVEPSMRALALPGYRHRHARINLMVAGLNVAVLGGAGLLISKVIEVKAAQGYHFGLSWLLDVQFQIPNLAIFVLNVVLYDFANYWIHRSQHQFRILWPLHRIHHTDPYLDVTSAFRFHPFETFYRVSIQAVVVVLLGMTPGQISAYLVIVVAALLFSHANIKLPRRIDRFLGFLLVTPDLHRIHHSVERRYHDSNFGIALIVWDRILGSYSHPDKTPVTEIGLLDYPKASEMRVRDILVDPLRS